MDKKKLYSYALTAFLFLIYAFFILKPNTLQHFSLIDDGEAFLLNYDNFENCLIHKSCGGLYDQTIEKSFGRFRPGRWAIDALLYSVFGNNPVYYHLFRVFALGLPVVLLLVYFLTKSKTNYIFASLVPTFFFLNFSFTENILRLGPDEIYQLFFFLLFSLLFLSRKLITQTKYLLVSIIFLFITLSIKETSLALLFVLPLYVYIVDRKNLRKSKIIFSLLAFSVVVLIGVVLSRSGVASEVYSSNYKLSLSSMVASLIWYLRYYYESLRPLPIFGIIGAFILVLRKYKLKNLPPDLLYFFLTFIGFTLVALPWGFSLERYVLIPIFAICFLAGRILTLAYSEVESNIFQFLKRFKYKKLVGFLMISLFFTNVVILGQIQNIVRSYNYSTWYSDFLVFESEEVRAIVALPTHTIGVDASDSINNWEVQFEIPIHAKYLYGKNIAITANWSSTDYILSTTELASEIDEVQKSQLSLHSHKEYETKQIDPKRFISDFLHRPIQTVMAKDDYTEKIFNSWSIYKL